MYLHINKLLTIGAAKSHTIHEVIKKGYPYGALLEYVVL